MLEGCQCGTGSDLYAASLETKLLAVAKAHSVPLAGLQFHRAALAELLGPGAEQRMDLLPLEAGQPRGPGPPALWGSSWHSQGAIDAKGIQTLTSTCPELSVPESCTDSDEVTKNGQVQGGDWPLNTGSRGARPCWAGPTQASDFQGGPIPPYVL